MVTIPKLLMCCRQRGFSLVELAIVLFILTILLAGIAVPLSAQVELRRTEDTRRQIDLAKDAIMGFLAANGRLPCPASSVSNGLESFCTTTSGACTPTTMAQTHGNCSNFYDGFLPATSLGLAPTDSLGYMRDPWNSAQNRIRYAVFDLSATVGATTHLHVLTGTDMMRTVTMSEVVGTGTPKNYLFVCAAANGGAMTTNCGTATQISSTVPAIIFSTGPSGAVEGTTKNTDGNRVFVSQDRTDGVNESDDVMTWLSINVIFNRLIAVGRLP